MLSRSVIDALEAGRAARDHDELSGVIGGFLADRGFENFTSALVVMNDEGDPVDAAWMENVTSDWFDYYADNGLAAHDYAIRRIAAEAMTEPFFIGRGQTERLSDLTAGERGMYDGAAEAGLNSGIAMPIPSSIGGVDVSGGFALWTGDDASAVDRRITEFGGEIATFLFGVHGQVLNALAAAASTENAALSPRERECLARLAEGLRPDAIADRLGVATVTIHRHLHAARDKLGARTLPAAVAKAMTAGLIDP